MKDIRTKESYIKIREAKRNGGSTILPLTGFIEEGKFYSIRKENGMVIVEPLDEQSKTIGI